MKVRDLIDDLRSADEDEDVVIIFRTTKSSDRLEDGDVLNIEDTGFSALIGNKGAHVLYAGALDES